jgi:thiamine-monophosphate kinase
MKLRESATGRIRCGELGEDRLLGQLLPSFSTGKDVLTGAGDDCAVVCSPGKKCLLLLKADCIVEKIHFASSADPVAVGWKAMMRPLSDFAAMSGLPQFALITLIIPARTSTIWVNKLYRGLQRAAARFGVSIVGGETSNTHGPAAISVSVAGLVEKTRLVLRRGGKAGDDLFVTGKLGGSLGGKHLQFLPRIEESRWLTKNFSVHAMIDLSDGLGADLPRLAKASKLSFKIEMEALPLNTGCKIDNAISDGEDYELLFAIASRHRKRLQNSWGRKFPKVPLTRVGQLRQKSKIKNHPSFRGYVHFQ